MDVLIPIKPRTLSDSLASIEGALLPNLLTSHIRVGSEI
jgi:hypothetical protein